MQYHMITYTAFTVFVKFTGVGFTGKVHFKKRENAEHVWLPVAHTYFKLV